MNNLFDDTMGNATANTISVLVIYDISEDKRRYKLVKILNGYGFRVQKSAFEARLNRKLYQRLLKEIENFVVAEDNIRIYKIFRENQRICFGKGNTQLEKERMII